MAAEENKDMEEELVGLSEDLARWNARRSKEEQYHLIEEESEKLRAKNQEEFSEDRRGQNKEGITEAGQKNAFSEQDGDSLKNGRWTTEELHRYRRAGDKIPEYTAGYLPSEEKFIRFTMAYYKKKIWSLVFIFWLALGLLAFSQYWMGNSFFAICMVILMALVPFLLFYLYKGQLRNLYRSSNKKLNLPVSIAFYKNYFLMKTERSSMIVYYEELKNIIDMETLYLLDIGGNALIPVDKDSCSESCRDFLEAVRKNLLMGR